MFRNNTLSISRKLQNSISIDNSHNNIANNINNITRQPNNKIKINNLNFSKINQNYVKQDKADYLKTTSRDHLLSTTIDLKTSSRKRIQIPKDSKLSLGAIKFSRDTFGSKVSTLVSAEFTPEKSQILPLNTIQEKANEKNSLLDTKRNIIRNTSLTKQNLQNSIMLSKNSQLKDQKLKKVIKDDRLKSK